MPIYTFFNKKTLTKVFDCIKRETKAVFYGNCMAIDGSGKELRTEKVSNFVGKDGATGVITRIKLKLTKPLSVLANL